jgi:hypothetical protein
LPKRARRTITALRESLRLLEVGVWCVQDNTFPKDDDVLAAIEAASVRAPTGNTKPGCG